MIDFFHQGNWTLPAILIISLVGWFWGCLKWLQLRTELDNGQTDPDLMDLKDVAPVRGHELGPKRFYDRIFSAALGRVQAGRPLNSEMGQEIVRLEILQLRQGLSFVGTIAMILPLLGLLGTVLGMMTTFGALSGPAGSPSVSLMSEGISQALITTQAGLVAAVPMLLFHGVLSSRIRRSSRRGIAALKHLETTLNRQAVKREISDV